MGQALKRLRNSLTTVRNERAAKTNLLSRWLLVYLHIPKSLRISGLLMLSV